ncbi:MAG: hypothetical protein P8X60_08470 [Robiginitalea sp.]|jgi:outer membrane murein-binding lipoprotein Lpp
MIRETAALPLNIFVLVILLLAGSSSNAQRKSDLINQIDSLQSQVRGLQKSLSETQAREKASLARAASYETQVTELKEANATLLQNLGNFADVSNKNSASLNQALASLNSRELQLKGIVETMSRNDSIIINLLSDAKGTLGADARLKVAAGSLVISAGLTELFGSDTGTGLTEEGKAWLGRVANLLKTHPDFGIGLDGLSMTGDIDLATAQATSVMNSLRNDYDISEIRMQARGRDGNFSEGVDILLHPDYRKFYQYVKDELKN